MTFKEHDTDASNSGILRTVTVVCAIINENNVLSNIKLIIE